MFSYCVTMLSTNEIILLSVGGDRHHPSARHGSAPRADGSTVGAMNHAAARGAGTGRPCGVARGPQTPMACSGPGNATADGSSKISAVRFRAESSCGRFDDTATVPSGRSASPDYRSNPHGGTMTRRTSMRKAPADPLPENANRRHAPLKRRRRWFRMVGGPDRPILLDPPPGDRRTPVAAHDGCRPMPIQGVGRILQKTGSIVRPNMRCANTMCHPMRWSVPNNGGT